MSEHVQGGAKERSGPDISTVLSKCTSITSCDQSRPRTCFSKLTADDAERPGYNLNIVYYILVIRLLMCNKQQKTILLLFFYLLL